MKFSRLYTNFFIAFLLMSLSFAPQAFAALDPMSILKENQKKIRAILSEKIKKDDKNARKKQADRIGKLLKPFFDFDYLSEKALSHHWAKLKKIQRQEYKFWLRALLENAYLKSLKLNYGKKDLRKIKIRYKGQKISKNKATVFTKIYYRNKRNRRRRIRINWLFYKTKNQWRVGDIITNDNSLIDIYQEQFDKIIAKKSFKELLRRLKKKVNQLRKKAGLAPLKFIPAKKASQQPAKKAS